MSEFRREDRYIVVKLKKLTHMQEKHLRAYLHGEGIQTIESVVVERDWPEYHLVWAMLSTAWPVSRCLTSIFGAEQMSCRNG